MHYVYNIDRHSLSRHRQPWMRFMRKVRQAEESAKPSTSGASSHRETESSSPKPQRAKTAPPGKQRNESLTTNIEVQRSLGDLSKIDTSTINELNFAQPPSEVTGGGDGVGVKSFKNLTARK